jgi:hypothetical protein
MNYDFWALLKSSLKKKKPTRAVMGTALCPLRCPLSPQPTRAKLSPQYTRKKADLVLHFVLHFRPAKGMEMNLPDGHMLRLGRRGLGVEEIAPRGYGNDQAGVRWIWFNLSSQAADVRAKNGGGFPVTHVVAQGDLSQLGT